MPKGYAIFSETIHDEEGYNNYIAQAAGVVMQYNGRLVAKADDPEVIEGTWPRKTIVILEFDSVDDAKTWYNSAEYQAVVGLRHASTDADAIIIPGFG